MVDTAGRTGDRTGPSIVLVIVAGFVTPECAQVLLTVTVAAG